MTCCDVAVRFEGDCAAAPNVFGFDKTDRMTAGREAVCMRSFSGGALSLGPPLAKARGDRGGSAVLRSLWCPQADGHTNCHTPTASLLGASAMSALLPFVSRRALVMTDAELRLMASAANITLPVDLL